MARIEEIKALSAELISAYGTADFERLIQSHGDLIHYELVKEVGFSSYQYIHKDANKALELIDVMQAVANRVDDPDGHALTIWYRGNAHLFLFQFEKALRCLREAEKHYLETDQKLPVAGIRINQILALRDMGRLEEAIKLSEEAEKVCYEAGEKADRYVINLGINISFVYYLMGDIDQAIKVTKVSLRLSEKLDKPMLAAISKLNLGYFYLAHNQVKRAENLMIEVKKYFTESKHTEALARQSVGLGKLYGLTGEFQKAFQFFADATEGYKKLPSEVALVEIARARIYIKINLAMEAILLAESAEKEFNRRKLKWQAAEALQIQGQGYQKLKLYDIAEAKYKLARSILVKQKSVAMLIPLDVERASLALVSGKFDRARRIASYFLSKSEIQSCPRQEIEGRLIVVEAYVGLGNIAKGERLLQSLLERDVLQDAPELQIKAYFLAAQFAEMRGEVNQSAELLKIAISKVERLRDVLIVDEMRLGFMEDKLPIYQSLVRIRHQQAEKKKTYFPLFYAIAQTIIAPQLNTNPANEASPKLKELRQQWQWYQSRLNEVSLQFGEIKIDSTRENALTIQKDARQLEGQIIHAVRQSNISNQNKALPFPTPAQSLEKIQASLPKNRIQLYYYIVDDAYQLLTVSNTGVSLLGQIAAVDEIGRILKSWRMLIGSVLRTNSDPKQKKAKLLLNRFYQLLVSPIEHLLLNVEQIDLVLPNELNDLPFSAFFNLKSYLIERFSFTYLTRIQAPEEFKLSPSMAGCIIGNSSANVLPFAKIEAERVQEKLSRIIQTEAVFDEGSTVEFAKRSMPNASLIHLATHAIFRSNNPLFSWVEMIDGKLTVLDIYQMRLLNKPLVVLSACDTARGKSRGGGTLGLARGFLSAGASNLICSLWKLHDQATANLMNSFYDSLIGSEGAIASSLQESQQSAIAKSIHPIYWAAFVHIT